MGRILMWHFQIKTWIFGKWETVRSVKELAILDTEQSKRKLWDIMVNYPRHRIVHKGPIDYLIGHEW